jgi:hypothetical protein
MKYRLWARVGGFFSGAYRNKDTQGDITSDSMIAFVLSLKSLGKSTKNHKDNGEEIKHHSLASILPRLKQKSQPVKFPPTPLPRL